MKVVSVGCFEIYYYEVGLEYGDLVIMFYGFFYDVYVYDVVFVDFVGWGFCCFVFYLCGYGLICFFLFEIMCFG